jgi:hypothetical protein
VEKRIPLTLELQFPVRETDARAPDAPFDFVLGGTGAVALPIVEAAASLTVG